MKCHSRIDCFPFLSLPQQTIDSRRFWALWTYGHVLLGLWDTSLYLTASSRVQQNLINLDVSSGKCEVNSFWYLYYFFSHCQWHCCTTTTWEVYQHHFSDGLPINYSFICLFIFNMWTFILWQICRVSSVAILLPIPLKILGSMDPPPPTAS